MFNKAVIEHWVSSVFARWSEENHKNSHSFQALSDPRLELWTREHNKSRAPLTELWSKLLLLLLLLFQTQCYYK